MLFDIPLAMLTLKISFFVLVAFSVALVNIVLYYMHGNDQHYDNQE